MNAVRTIRIGPKRGCEHHFPWTLPPRHFKVKAITEEQAANHRWLLDQFIEPRRQGTETLFAVIPNGLFLPVPIAHYQ